MGGRATFFHETMVDNDKFGKLETKVTEIELTVLANKKLIDALHNERQELHQRCAMQEQELQECKAILQTHDQELRDQRNYYDSKLQAQAMRYDILLATMQQEVG